MIAAVTRPSLYLAGPDVFRQNAEEFGQALKATCLNAGFTPLWPLDQEPPEAELSPRQMAHRICSLNLRMLQKADAVLANIEPFRGPGMDAGTAFEIGVAFAIGKPVFAYSSDFRSYAQRVSDQYHGHRRPWAMRLKPVGEEIYAEGMQVENFGLEDNLMIACTVKWIAGSAEEALDRAALWRDKDWRP
ncbi:nucleoside 2-deoxyribosyltransferase [Hyphomonas sp.]|uniref:nucleoside 2-deoxyribosyltransferase n=1 Tax=Hyphomonas sp. TaxID=87 RepID=UPI0025C2705D|nr:nucleoside 2-deoxyribosyltransferase [Hyphomonas sp.]